MKYTGIALMILGVGILMFSLLFGSFTSQPPQQAQEVQGNRMDLLFPILMGVIALVAGGAMYFYGGRGYIATRNPAVRN